MAGEGDYYAWKDAAGACVQRRLDELELRMAKLEGKAGGKKIQGLVLRDLGLASEHALVRELTEERWGDEVALLVMDEDGGCLLTREGVRGVGGRGGGGAG